MWEICEDNSEEPNMSNIQKKYGVFMLENLIMVHQISNYVKFEITESLNISQDRVHEQIN